MTEAEIVEHLAESKKYSFLCSETLHRIVTWALDRHSRPADALKAAKRKLHQVYGAYVSAMDRARIAELVSTMALSDVGVTRMGCREILAMHKSTKERLNDMASMYEDIFAVSGMPSTICDLACGLNPFALPWMGLPDSTKYMPSDIDARMMDTVNQFLVSQGRPATAQSRDLLVSRSTARADIVLLLKVLPCLERQEKDVSRGLLQSLCCRWVVISFPARSLGGREKGMVAGYRAFLAGVASQTGCRVEERTYPRETVYLLERTTCSSGLST